MRDGAEKEGGGRDAPVLVCRGVAKTWHTGGAATEALRRVDLAVGAREVVALLGPSGCGKSTLLQLIAGLEPPSAGKLVFRGASVTGPAPDRMLVFQQPSLFPWLSVWENVSFGLGLGGMARTERRQAARRILAEVGLDDVADVLPSRLSVGMRQRAAVARALSMRPGLLLLDEPFAALDIQTRRKMQDFLARVCRETDATVLLVTHDLDEALALADRIVLLSARPGHVKAEFPVPAAGEDGVAPLRRRIAEELAAEVDLAFAEQEAGVMPS